MQFHSFPAIIAMLLGVATFIFGYAFITSTSLYGKVHEGLIGRSIKLGTRIRMIISVVSIPLLFSLIGYDMDRDGEPPTPVLFAPDFWFGYGALIISALALGGLREISGSYNAFSSMSENFFFPYFTTVIEGILISLSLIFIAFITLIVLNVRKNRQQMPAYHIPPGPDH